MGKKWVVFLPILLAGCAPGSDSGDRLIQMNSDLPVAETVDGVAVPQVLLEAFARGRGADLSKPEQREQVLRVFADYVLLAEQARRDRLFAKPQFAAEVEIARLSALAKATMNEMQAQTPLTDAALRAEYDAQVAHASKVQYDFSQLLFDNEGDALKASGEVLAGKPFAQVYDAWKSKAKQAKVFTRVRPEQLPEALSQALAGLKNGQTAPAPIKTEFGWHVIHLDIANPFTPPPFEQVKENIRRTLALKVGEERLEQLKAQAKIGYPPGSLPVPGPKPAANVAPTAPPLPGGG